MEKYWKGSSLNDSDIGYPDDDYDTSSDTTGPFNPIKSNDEDVIEDKQA